MCDYPLCPRCGYGIAVFDPETATHDVCVKCRERGDPLPRFVEFRLKRIPLTCIVGPIAGGGVEGGGAGAQ